MCTATRPHAFGIGLQQTRLMEYPLYASRIPLLTHDANTAHDYRRAGRQPRPGSRETRGWPAVGVGRAAGRSGAFARRFVERGIPGHFAGAWWRSGRRVASLWPRPRTLFVGVQ